jgi:hypothetical protein
LVVVATSDGLMTAPKEGPGKPEGKGDRVSKEESTQEASHFGHTQRDEDVQALSLTVFKEELDERTKKRKR